MTALEWITRFAPAGFFAFVAVFYTIRILTLQNLDQKKRTSIRNPDGRLCPAHITFRVLRVLILLVSIGYAASPAMIQPLGLFPFIASPWIMIIGDMMLFGAFAFVCSAHMTMGDSWRSGIPVPSSKASEEGDKEAALPLVTHGLFAWSRNPTYIGVAMGQFGFFLALPCAFSLACLIIGAWALAYRVKQEEEYLMQTHGEAYRAYCDRTPRWISFPVFLGARRRA